MQYHPMCKKKLCRICHAHTYEQLKKEQELDTPRYAKSTALTKSRAIAVAIASPKPIKHVSYSFPERTGVSFMKLPVEVRLQIYRNCVEYRNGKGVMIRGWFKGGGHHADDELHGAGGFVKRLHIYASHGFYASVLRLNRTVYHEARDEVYRGIGFHVEGKIPQVHLTQLRYWLNEHLMRFARHVTFTLDFPLGAGFDGARGTETRGQRSLITSSEIQSLAKILAKMPNLKIITLLLRLNTCVERGTPLPTMLMHCANNTNHIRKLKIFQKAAPESAVLKLVVNFSEQFARWGTGRKNEREQMKKDILNKLEVQGFDVERATKEDLSSLTSSWSWGI